MKNSKLLYQTDLNKLELLISKEIDVFFEPEILNVKHIEKSE